MKVRDIAPYGVRMPADLKEKLQSIAKKNGRSLNSEIVRILEEYIQPPVVDDPRTLSEDELRSPEKVKEWVEEINHKIAIIEKVVRKNFTENNQ